MPGDVGLQEGFEEQPPISAADRLNSRLPGDVRAALN
jgi:hypothetical protein